MKNKLLFTQMIFIAVGLLWLFGSWSFSHIDMTYRSKTDCPISKSTIAAYPPPCSTGEIFGFYADIYAANPVVIDVVDFPKMNGSTITLSNPLSSVSYNVSTQLRPLNTSSIDPTNTEFICVLSEEGLLLNFNDNSCSLSTANLAPAKTTAPVHINNQIFAIDVENNGVATGGTIDVELASLDIPTGLFSGLGLFTFNAIPPYFFTHESMSSATNGVDQLYFLSGSFLLVFSGINSPTITLCTFDLDPSRQYGYYGLEYLASGKLLAIQNDYGTTSGAVDLVEINFSCLPPAQTYGITPIYDIQNNLSPAMIGDIFSIDYYSTTIDSCDQRYYLTTQYNNSSQSRLVEIDLVSLSHVEQILPKFLFGIEYKAAPCPTNNGCCDDYDDFLNTASNVQFNGTLGDCMVHFNAMGLDSCMKVTYSWGDGTPDDGPIGDNVEVWHTYPSSGTYTVCYLIEEFDQGVLCWEYQICEDVEVLCDQCCMMGDSLIVNGSFTGITPGDLLNVNTPFQWNAAQGSPQASNSDGCKMPGMIQMWGNSQIGEVLIQSNPNGIFKKDSIYQISFCAKFLNILNLPPNLAHGWFRLQAGNAASSTITAMNVAPGAQIGVSQTIHTENIWENVCMVPWKSDADYDAIYIHFANSSFFAGADSTSFGRIDDLCIEVVGTSSLVEQPKDKPEIVVYPNPSSGQLFIESQSPIEGGQLQIVDISGKLILSKELLPNTSQQNISLNNMSDGFYFLRIIENGHPIYHQKILIHNMK